MNELPADRSRPGHRCLNSDRLCAAAAPEHRAWALHLFQTSCRAAVARAVHGGSSVKRHVHRCPDGLVILCVRGWCAPGWREAAIRRALLIAVPFAAVAASATFGRPRLAIVLGALAAIALAVRATMALGARIDGGAVAPPRTTRRSRTG